LRPDSLANSLRDKKVRIIFQILGVFLFIVILVRVELSEVLRYFSSFDILDGLIILAILIIFTFVKGLRWRLLVSRQGLDISRFRAFSIYSAGIYLGIVTPGRVGNFIKSLYLINRGYSAGKSIFSSLVDRMFDMIFLVIIGYVSLLFFPGILRNQYLLSTLILAFTAVIAVLFFWRRDLLSIAASKITSMIFPARIVEKTDRAISDVLGEFETLDKATIAKALLLTFTSWVLNYVTFFSFARILSIDISIPFMVASVSAVIFTGLLPISLFGLGTRELVLIVIFNSIGLSREAAVAFSFCFILVHIVQSVIGMICWLTGPFHSEDLSRIRRG
jgi:uncharacterized protein (TIRG00374 family)